MLIVGNQDLLLYKTTITKSYITTNIPNMCPVKPLEVLQELMAINLLVGGNEDLFEW